MNSAVQEETDAPKKVEVEKQIIDSIEKLEYYRTKMQDLVLYKSRCDNRLNEITERALKAQNILKSLLKGLITAARSDKYIYSSGTASNECSSDLQGEDIKYDSYAPRSTSLNIVSTIDLQKPIDIAQEEIEYVDFKRHSAWEKCPTAIQDFEGDQTYNEKPDQDFALTASFDSVEALSYDAFVIPGGQVPEYFALTKLKCVMQTWLPASNALFEMIIFHLSYPSKTQKHCVENLYEGLLDNIYAIAFRNCDSEGLLMLYIFKMFPTSDKDRFLACGHVFSGKEATGMKVRIMGPNYVPDQNKDLHVKSVQRTAIWRGKKQESVEDVPCGNTFVMVGLDQLSPRTATLTNEKEVDACLIRTMTFSVFPVMSVAVQCKVASDLPNLLRVLKRLANPDLMVPCKMEESGEHICAGVGELLLEICLKNLLKKLLGRMLADGTSHFLCLSLATKLLFCVIPSLHCLILVLSILLNQKSNFKKHSRNLMPRLTNHGFLIIILEDKYALEGKEMSEPAILEYLKKGRSLKEITLRCVQVASIRWWGTDLLH